MKKINLLLSLLFVLVTIYAQDYRISFAGSGESSNVGTVTVENLTQAKSLTLNGAEVLRLVASTTGINPISEIASELCIYPNPTNGNSTINFATTSSGKVNIELFDITGKRVGSTQNIITNGIHSFQVSNLKSGIYTIRVSSQSYKYTSKLTSKGTSNSEVKIDYLGNGIILDNSMKLKSANTKKTMQYTTGDRLKITGISGKYSTVVADVPTQSKTITFSFVSCTDTDGRNYPVIKIGTQTWMAENLAYLPSVFPPSVGSYSEPRCYVYDFLGTDVASAKLTANYSIHGVLYNWNAAKVACPSGWHLPTDAEMTTLENYLITNGFNYDLTTSNNKIGKSMAATYIWNKSSFSGGIGNNLTANNRSGFSILPSGRRDYLYGIFQGIGNISYMWSITDDGYNCAWYRSLGYLYADWNHHSFDTACGYSVRCIKD